MWHGGLGVFFEIEVTPPTEAAKSSSALLPESFGDRQDYVLAQKCLNVHIWNLYLSMYTVYLYWHRYAYIYICYIYIVDPENAHPKTQFIKNTPKKLIKSACFSCASDSLLSFSSSCWLWHPKSHRMDDLQSRTAENPKIGGYPLGN